ncbi:hemagglutinin repeat-containing protein, partial [Campylobacter blaseri]
INSDIFNSENSNIVATNGNLDITSNSINLNNSNQIAALNDINFKSNNANINGVNLFSQNANININSSNLNAIKANIGANKITLNIKDKIDLSSSKVLAMKDLGIKTKDFNNQKANINANEQIDIIATNLNNSEAKIATNSNLNINNIKEFTNNNGSLLSNKDLNLNSINFNGKSSNIQAKNISINSDIFNSENSNIVATNGNLDITSNSINLNNSNQIAALNDINFKSNNANINGVNLFSQNANININSSNLNAIKANIYSKLSTNINTKENIYAKNINLQADKIDIKAKDLILSQEKINKDDYDSKLISNTTINIDVNSIKNINGYIAALKDITISSNNLDNSYGLITANKDLTISTDIFKNKFGSIISGKNLMLNLANYNDTNSTIQSNKIELNSQNLALNHSNIISTTKDINLNIKDSINLDSSLLYSKHSIDINSKELNANRLKAQANSDINFNISDINLNNSNIYSVADINSKYKNGYRQGDINFKTENLLLQNSNLASKDISIKTEDNKKIDLLSLNNSNLEANQDINIFTKRVNSLSSTLTSLNNLSLYIDDVKIDDFKSSNFSSKNIALNVNKDLSLNNTNSFRAAKDIDINANSITNSSTFISNDKIDIKANDYIENSGLLSSLNYINLKAKNYITNNDLATNQSAIKSASIEINTEKLTNHALILSLKDMNIKANNIQNYGAIALSSKNSDSLNIISSNLKNYNTIYSNNILNLYIKDTLINKTDKTKVDLGDEKSIIFAKNGINIQADKDRSLRTKKIINDKATIQSLNGNINIFANSLENLNDKVEIGIKDDEKEKINLKQCRGKGYLSCKKSIFSRLSKTSIGEEPIIEDIKKEEIANGKYYNEAYIGKECFFNQNNCLNHDGSAIVNGVKYSKNEITIIKSYWSAGYKIHYKDRSPKADTLPKFHSGKVDSDEIIKRLKEKYKNFSDVFNVEYNRRYYLKLKSPYYVSNAKQYYFYYNSKKDYLLKDVNIANGGLILSGKNINLDIGNISNYLSTISAKNSLNFKDTTLNNQSENLYFYNKITGKYEYCYKECNSFWHDPNYTWATLPPIENRVKIDSIDSVIEAGNQITGNLVELNNENKAKINNIEFTTYDPNIDTNINKVDITNNIIKKENELVDIKDSIEKTDNNINLLKDSIEKVKSNKIINTINDNFNLSKNKYSFFIHNPNNPNYLIESNPLYTDLSHYLGSSYFLQKINYRSDRKIKSIGDAAYETKLVSDALKRHLGRAYIDDNYFTDPNAQYVKLMNSAVNQSSILGLTLGKELTREQLANLKEDIVWYVSKTINNEEVLVPIVYLAKDYKKTDGATIIAKNIKLDIKDDLINSGNIISKDYLNLQANTITNNTGLLISGKKINLIANNDIVNKNGATIKSNDINILSKYGSVINETFVNQVKSGDNYNNTTYTQISKPSSIIAKNGNLVVLANKDITNIASNLKAKETITLATQTGSIDVNTKELKDEFNAQKGRNFYKSKDTSYLSSNVEAKDIVINSNKDINIEASNLKADNLINLNADKNINITALNSVKYRDIQTYSKGSFGSSKTKRDMSYKESVNSSSLQAKNILLNSKNDINLEASKLKAQDNIVANAKADINVFAKDYATKELHYKKKKGFGGFSKSVSLNSKDNLNLHSAKLQTEAKNIILNSNKDINILASELLSASDIELKALDDVLISSRQELEKTINYSKKTKFNPLGVLNLVGIDVAPLYLDKLHKDDNVKSKSKESILTSKGNTIIDSGSTSIIGSNINSDKNIYIKADTGKINIISSLDTLNRQTLDKKVEVKVSNLAKQIKNDIKGLKDFNTRVKLQIAEATYDKEAKISKDTLNSSSNLFAKEDIISSSISDTNIKGSNLKAGGNVVLNSKIGDVNILNSSDTKDENVKEEHLKAALSLTAQNEYVEIATAVKQAQEAAKQLKNAKSDYTNYKKEVKKLENKLSELKSDYKNKKVGVDYSDIENLVDIVNNLKSQEKYYLIDISAATINLATKTSAIASQAAAASGSNLTYGFSVGVSADVSGEKSNTTSTSTTSTPSNIYASNILINTDEKLNTNTNIKGSNLIANDEININTHNLNVSASSNFGSTNKNTKSINGSVNFTMYGGGGGTASIGYGQSRYDSNSLAFNNSNLKASNININAINDALFKGTTLRANDTLNLKAGNNLDVISLQDKYSYSNKGFNVSAGVGFGNSNKAPNRKDASIDIKGISSANAGFNTDNSIGLNKQSVLTSLTANNVNIDVKNNTHLKGSLIASGKFTDEGNFIYNENLNFKTDTLTFENLSNTNYSSSKSTGININLSLKDKENNTNDTTSNSSSNKDINLNNDNIKTLATNNNINNKDSKKTTLTNSVNSNANYNSNNKVNDISNNISSLAYSSSNSLNVNSSKTLATLGKGSITIINKANSDDLARLNTDTSKLSLELYNSYTSSKVDASLDTRLLSKEGRKDIEDDYNMATAITKAIYQIASTNKASIGSFFKENEKYVKVYNTLKHIVANDTNLANYLKDPNLDIEKKQVMLNVLTLNVMQNLGYIPNDTKVIYTDAIGSNNTPIKGHYNIDTNVNYINDKYNKNTKELITSLGHEMTHAIDNQKGILILNDPDQNRYATIFGKDLADFSNKALNIITDKSLAKTNNHNLDIVTTNNSIFNTSHNTLINNNKEFINLDKSKGDDKIYIYRDKVLAMDKINDNKIVDLTTWEAISNGYLNKDIINLITKGRIALLQDYTKILNTPDNKKYKYQYDLNNPVDFEKLRSKTQLNYDNVDLNSKIVFVNGMGNNHAEALEILKEFKKDYGDNVGLINNVKGPLLYIGDAIEWLPNFLTKKDVLTAYKLKQLSPDTIIVAHSAGNEDIYKANKINKIQNVKTPYKFISVGSPKSATGLKKSMQAVDAKFIIQINHPHDPIANGWLNSDANYEYKNWNDLIKYHPFLEQYYDAIELFIEDKK